MTSLLAAAETDLSAAHFREIGSIVYDVAGILLPPGKEGLVRSRLGKRLRARGATSYEAYLAIVRDRNSGELAEMVDALTTNKTDFFREPAHFEFLKNRVLPTIPSNQPLRIWSAGCSSGEEPYTLAMVLREHVADLARRDAKILATDISKRVLTHAKAGIYPEAVIEGVPPELRRKHFARSPEGWRASSGLQSLITFGQLNLMGTWPMKGPFQAIFCRNVMIYFDRATQQTLIRRYHELLAPGGYLFVGHSESLSALKHDFAYVQPAVYQK